MEDRKLLNIRKTAAGIMGLLMLVIVLFSAFYLAAEADHHCSGEDCPVCVCMQQCENTLHRVSSRAVTHSIIAVPVSVLFFAAFLPAVPLRRETPVTNKVRLNN